MHKEYPPQGTLLGSMRHSAEELVTAPIPPCWGITLLLGKGNPCWGRTSFAPNPLEKPLGINTTNALWGYNSL
jgi:hypothetical protein